MKVNGSYSYMGPDGVFYKVRYTADDQGFHPEGDHIKVPPFVPWIHRHGETNGDSAYHADQNILNSIIGTTLKPTTQYLPAYSPEENLQNIVSSTPQPTTEYLPQVSNNLNYVTGESNLNQYRPEPTNEYLPTSSSRPKYSSFDNRNLDITIFSTPHSLGPEY